MPYHIELKPAAIKGLRGLPKSIQKKTSSKIDSLANNPLPSKAKKLEGLEKIYRLRVGDYRILYQIQKKVLLILVISIGHRKQIYKHLKI